MYFKMLLFRHIFSHKTLFNYLQLTPLFLCFPEVWWNLPSGIFLSASPRITPSNTGVLTSFLLCRWSKKAGWPSTTLVWWREGPESTGSYWLQRACPGLKMTRWGLACFCFTWLLTWTFGVSCVSSIWIRFSGNWCKDEFWKRLCTSISAVSRD